MNKRVFKNGNDVPVDPSTGLRQSQGLRASHCVARVARALSLACSRTCVRVRIARIADDVVDKQLTLGTNVAMGNPQYPDGER